MSDSSKVNSGSLAQALQITQEGMAAFQRLQEQTAQLHRQFLQGQESAQQTLNRLIEQQQQLILSSLGAMPIPHIVPRPSPPPVVAPPAPVAKISPPPAVSRPAAQARSTAPASNKQQVQQVLLEVVSEKTGYPAEMLNADMGLDADLGIDSIKRVEILSTLQERLPNAPVVKPEHLGTLNTLSQIVDFLAGSETSPSAAPIAASPSIHNGASGGVEQVLLETVSEKTGYPTDMLNLDMGLDADLGIDSIKRVEILSTLQERLPNAPIVKPEHLGTLNTLRQVAAFLSNGSPAPARPPDTSQPTNGDHSISRKTLRSTPLPFDRDRPAVTLPPGSEVILVAGADRLADQLCETIRACGHTVRRVFWDSSVDSEIANVAGLVLLSPLHSNLGTLRQAFRWLRACSRSLRVMGKKSGAVFATISRLDGAFGLEAIGKSAQPISGGLAGLAKTAHHEWLEVSCKAIDVKPDDTDIGNLTARLADELFRSGPIEVGVSSQQLTTLELADADHPQLDSALLSCSDVVVITGGGRGVTAETAVVLAEAYRPTLVLLGRSPVPGAESDWLQSLSDEKEIKRALGARANGSASPKEIGRQYQELHSARELRQNLNRIAAAGSRVVYRSVDVREPDAVAATLAQVRDEFGPITGLIHGAGVIEDRLIEDKTDEQFDRVLGTKVEGLLNLLQATQDDPLKILTLFSSSTGRFGRKGQVDYAVANEVLNKMARAEATRRPDCRVVAVNWGPWEGGMVTPGLRRVFEQEGVGLIPLNQGAQFLLGELSAADRPVEVVAGVWLDQPKPTSPGFNPPVVLNANLVPVLDRDISVANVPILASHIIERRAVFPLALHMEWLAHAALHGNPGLAFFGLNGVRVLQGIKLVPEESRAVRLFAGKMEKHDGEFHVPVEMCGVPDQGLGHIHSRGEVILRNALVAEKATTLPNRLKPYAKTIAETYRTVLFHGPELQGLVGIEGISDNAIVALARTAPPPETWIADPFRRAWLTDPLVIDAAFQLMICWGVEQRGMPNLPARIGSYRQFRRAFPPGQIRIVARITRGSGPLIRAAIEFLDGPGNLIARIDDGEFVGDPSLAAAFRRNRLSTAAV